MTLHLFGVRRLGADGGGSELPPLVAKLSSALPSWMTLTRNLVAFYRIADSVEGEQWRSVVAHAPRFHRPTGVAGIRGLLVEPQRVQRCKQCSTLNTAPWVNVGTAPIITEGSIPGPDGQALSACGLEDDTAGAGHPEAREQPSMGFSNGDVVISTLFGRRLTAAQFGIAFFNGTDYTYVSDTSLLWKRIELLKTMGANDANNRITVVPVGATFPNAGSTEVGKSAIWVVMCEVGLWPSSPVEAIAAAVTRPPDVAAIPIEQLGGRITAERGRVRVTPRFQFANTEEAAAVWPFGLKTTDGLRFQGTDDRFEVLNGNVRVADVPCTFSRYTDKIVLGWSWGDGATELRVWKNGVFVGEDTGVWTPPTLGANCYLGADGAGLLQAGATYEELVIG